MPLASVEPRPALFRDGAFSCRHELPRALAGLAGNSGYHFGSTVARPHGTCGMFKSLFRLLPTRAHAPRKRFAAPMGLTPRRRRLRRHLCGAKTRPRESGAATRPIAVPLGKGCGENPLARRCASPCRVNPLPQAARAAPAQRRIFVRTEARVSDRAQCLAGPVKGVDDGLLLYSCPLFVYLTATRCAMQFCCT